MRTILKVLMTAALFMAAESIHADIISDSTQQALIVNPVDNPVQVTGIVTVSALPAALGQQIMADSVSVVVASDQVVPVSGPLTDTQLRASPVAVDGSGSVQPVSGPLTDTELRLSPVPVSGPITDAELRATPLPVSGPLTDAELRLTAVAVDGSATIQPVSASALPLPIGAATSSLQATANASLSSIDTKLTAPLSVSGPLTDTELRASAVPVSLASVPLPSGAAAEATLSSFKTANHTDLGTINTTLGSPFQAGGSIGNTAFTANAGTNLNTSALSLEATQSAFKTANHTDLGAINTTLGTPFQAGGSIGNTTFACTQSGTFTVQPGNTANTTAWKVDGSAVTQPVSLASLPSLAAGSAVIGHVIVDSAPTTAVTIATAPVLVAGSAIIGKVGIDQTTPGTTNGVQVNAALPAGSNVIGHVIVDTAPSTAVTGPLTDTQLRASAVPVSLSTLPALVAGSAVIGHVINDSGSTTAVTGNVASTVADGANVTLGAKADAKSTATDTTAVTVMSVLKEISAMEQAPASRAVTNAGTFAVQAAATEADGASVTLGAKADAKSTATDTTAVTVMQVLKEISAMEQAPASRAVTNAGTFAAQCSQSGTFTVQPGNTANTTAWLMSINDGTNTAKVQAASTAAAAADKALTVVQSPNGLNPCMNPGSTLVSITGATSGTSAVQIIALSGSTKIYICSMNIIGVSGTTPTFSLVQGTGSNCVTGQTVLQQAWTTAAGTIYAFSNPVSVSVAGNAVCYKGTGTTPVQNYTIAYVQQ